MSATRLREVELGEKGLPTPAFVASVAAVLWIEPAELEALHAHEAADALRGLLDADPREVVTAKARDLADEIARIEGLSLGQKRRLTDRILDAVTGKT